MATKIEWTDETWNPIRGCSRVSEGCRNCYAEKTAYRFSGPGMPYEGLVQIAHAAASKEELRLSFDHRLAQWNGKIKFVEEHLLDPLRWKKPRRIFVNSMSDLFHENVTDEMRDKIFAVMALCPQHTFQVLTKRPERMLAYLGDFRNVPLRILRATEEVLGGKPRPVESLGLPRMTRDYMLPNVWMGVSVEDQKTADERIPLLLQTPAAVRFISAEPLLGAIDLFKVPRPDVPYFQWRGEAGAIGPKDEPDDYVYWMKQLLHWVICGGESGPGARPMHPDWARSLRDQCEAAGVPFFFKQWGEWGPGSVLISSGERVFREFADKQQWINHATSWINGGICMDATGFELKCGADFDVCSYPVTVIHRIGKKAAGHLLDGKEYHQFPAVSA